MVYTEHLPFIFFLSSVGAQTFQTKVIDNDLAPEWDQMFEVLAVYTVALTSKQKSV